jgi:TusA-related sulfurtransferase
MRAIACSLVSRSGVSYNWQVMASSEDTIFLDLIGIKCPLNWAHAKVRLEQMKRGQVLEILLDDPRGARDIPLAAESEGYVMLDSRAEGRKFRLRIEK